MSPSNADVAVPKDQRSWVDQEIFQASSLGKASPIPMFACIYIYIIYIYVVQYIDYLLGMRIQECFKHDVTSI